MIVYYGPFIIMTCGGPSFGGHHHEVICLETTWSGMMLLRHDDRICVPLNLWLIPVAVVVVGNRCRSFFLSTSSRSSPHLTCYELRKPTLVIFYRQSDLNSLTYLESNPSPSSSSSWEVQEKKKEVGNSVWYWFYLSRTMHFIDTT